MYCGCKCLPFRLGPELTGLSQIPQLDLWGHFAARGKEREKGKESDERTPYPEEPYISSYGFRVNILVMYTVCTAAMFTLLLT